VPHQALPAEACPTHRARSTRQSERKRGAYRPAQTFTAQAQSASQPFDLSVSGDNWEVVLADLVGQSY
jgi:hypothetical protein